MQGFADTELTDVERKAATSMRGQTDQLACSKGMSGMSQLIIRSSNPRRVFARLGSRYSAAVLIWE